MCFQDLTLHFVVLSFDRYSRDDVIGEVMVELNNIDFGTAADNARAPISISKEIMPRSFKVRVACGVCEEALQNVFLISHSICSNVLK